MAERAVVREDVYKANIRDPLDPAKIHSYQELYKSQTKHTFDPLAKPFDVPIWYCNNSNGSAVLKWFAAVDKVIEEINEAAPGLSLYKVQNKAMANIHVSCLLGELTAHTTGNVLIGTGKAYVCLGTEWPEYDMGPTALHELLHALGFEHEHQQHGANEYMDFSKTSNPEYSGFQNDIVEKSDMIAITRFDPFSVMIYYEGFCELRHKDNPADNVWNLKPGNAKNLKMSELDKVALNMIYKPCFRDNFQPELCGLYICGRPVMKDHNYPGDFPIAFGGKCGDRNINCPACRTLKTDKILEIWSQGKWQGWSGLVYCGKHISVNGQNCGPDIGENCTDCQDILDL
jgi:hypothetical protein